MLFIETIRIWQRQAQNLDLHSARLHHTRAQVWQKTDFWDLAQIIQIPDEIDEKLYKCRLTYGKTVEKIEFEPYHPRPIQSLKLIHANDLEYTYKYADRRQLNELFAQRGEADDVLLVKNGLISDTSYCNVALGQGKQWFTPASPLLNGIRRQSLLQQKMIIEKVIKPSDLPNFEKIRLFNAMIGFAEAWELPIQNIRF
ncbi:MAG: aminotransferase class IV family protein [Microscillaceae bacterium]|jgi:4-amino-4-deoxychorismate lyase|nr:aminotransferase class IV family protein [Microscillaceae bacterium]